MLIELYELPGGVRAQGVVEFRPPDFAAPPLAISMSSADRRAGSMTSPISVILSCSTMNNKRGAGFTADRPDRPGVAIDERCRGAARPTLERVRDRRRSTDLARQTGYFVFEADDMDAAIKLAGRIPAARLGGAVEIRPAEQYW